MNEYQEHSDMWYVKRTIWWSLFGGVILIFLLGYVVPVMKPWWAQQDGKAELAQAEQNRQIKVIEAEAAKTAEITRAEGVAKANEIIGSSLKGNEDYLRYLYITGLTEQTNKEVIYIPTEATMPILEAGRLK
jgi:hypothetical protein